MNFHGRQNVLKLKRQEAIFIFRKQKHTCMAYCSFLLYKGTLYLEVCVLHEGIEQMPIS